jgi:predicted DNA-binding transcriptional regulator
MVKVLVWPVVLYGCETWALLKDENNRLQALEVWLWRGLENITWRYKISNEEVLAMLKKKGCQISTRQIKKNWIGYVLRENE